MPAAVGVINAQNRAIRALRDAGALSPDRARSFDQVGVRENWIARRLVARGVFARTEDGRYYLVEERLARFIQRRRIIACVILLVGVALAFGAGASGGRGMGFAGAASICVVSGVWALARARP